MEGQRTVGGIGGHPKLLPHRQPATILLLGAGGTVDHAPAGAVVVSAEWEAAVVALTAADQAVAAAIPAAVPCRACGRVAHGGVCGDGLGRLTEGVAEALSAGHGVTLAALVPPVVVATKPEGTAVSSALEQAEVAAPGSVDRSARGGQHMTAEIGGHAQQGMNLSNLLALATMMRLIQNRQESVARSVSGRIHSQRQLHPAQWFPSYQG